MVFCPAKEVVIIRSGDIGLIMAARRLTWSGVKVKAVVDYALPGRTGAQYCQCLDDFNIPSICRIL